MKINKAFTGLALALTLGLSSFFSAGQSMAQTKAEIQDEISGLEDSQASLEDSLAQKRQQQSEILATIEELDGQIEGILGKLSGVKKDIKKKNKEIAANKEKLEVAKADQEKQYKAFKARIKAIYEAGEISYLDVLLGNSDMRVLLNGDIYAGRVNEYDKTLLAALETTEKQIEIYEDQLEEQQKELEEKKKNYESEKASMESILEERQAEVQQLDGEIDDTIYDLSAIEEKIAAENASMAEIIAEEEAAQKAAEEEAARAAAEETLSQSSDEEETDETEDAAWEDSDSSDEASDDSDSSDEDASDDEDSDSDDSDDDDDDDYDDSDDDDDWDSDDSDDDDSDYDSSDYGSSSWDGEVLSPFAGVVYGPSGKETYYNLDMSGVVWIMRNMGFDEDSYPYWVRGDGCKMLGDYIMCAAALDVHPRGTTVESSLGTCLVCDTGGFAYSNPYQLDIATDW